MLIWVPRSQVPGPWVPGPRNIVSHTQLVIIHAQLVIMHAQLAIMRAQLARVLFKAGERAHQF